VTEAIGIIRILQGPPMCPMHPHAPPGAAHLWGCAFQGRSCGGRRAQARLSLCGASPCQQQIRGAEGWHAPGQRGGMRTLCCGRLHAALWALGSFLGTMGTPSSTSPIHLGGGSGGGGGLLLRSGAFPLHPQLLSDLGTRLLHCFLGLLNGLHCYRQVMFVKKTINNCISHGLQGM
jgi:hypothetical protein